MARPCSTSPTSTTRASDGDGRSREGGPAAAAARRDLRLDRRAGGHHGPVAQGPLRGRPPQGRLGLHPGKRHPGPDPPPALHRYLPPPRVRPVLRPGVHEPVLHRAQRPLRRLGAGHAPLGRVRAHPRHRAAHAPHRAERELQAPARAELGVRGAALLPHPRPRRHRGDAADGQRRLLDRGGGHQHPPLHPLHRQRPAHPVAGRRFRRPDHPHPHLRHPHLGAALPPLRAHRRPPLPAPPPR